MSFLHVSMRLCDSQVLNSQQYSVGSSERLWCRIRETTWWTVTLIPCWGRLSGSPGTGEAGCGSARRWWPAGRAERYRRGPEWTSPHTDQETGGRTLRNHLRGTNRYRTRIRSVWEQTRRLLKHTSTVSTNGNTVYSLNVNESRSAFKIWFLPHRRLKD